MQNRDASSGTALKELFPYMFDKPNAGFAFYRGWMPAIAGCCIDIDQLLGEQRELFHWIQIKEKYGAARMYYSFAEETAIRLDIKSPDGFQSIRGLPGDRSPIGLAIDRLVDAAEKETAQSCMVCGRASETQRYDGYLLTLCDDHHPEKLPQHRGHLLNSVLKAASADDSQ